MRFFCAFLLDKLKNFVYNKDMMIASIVCLFVACLALAVAVCFTSRNKFANLFLSFLSLIALICLCIVCASRQNDFSLYVILLILSITPMFLKVGFSSSERKQIENQKNQPKKSENQENDESEESLEAETIKSQENNKLQTENLENQQSQEKINAFVPVNIFEKYGNLVAGVSLMLSAICIVFCALYLGVESVYGILAGIAIGFALTFLDEIIRKSHKKATTSGQIWAIYLEKFLFFVSAGLLLACVILALMYSLALPNILFSLGALLFAIYVLMEIYLKNRFNHLIYFASMFLMIATILI